MVLCKPDEVVDVFYDSVYNSSKSELLAEDKENGIEVLMYDDSGYPKIIVMVDGYVVDAVTIDEPLNTESVVEEIYSTFIYMNQPDDVDDTLIKERQEELEGALVDFLSVVLEENIKNTEKVVTEFVPELLDSIMEQLYRKYNIDPYRPMVLVDENDEEFFEEYPYSCMEFD